MSMDFFGYLDSLLRQQLEKLTPEQLKNKTQNYLSDRNLTRVVAALLQSGNIDLLATVSPALAWQIAETGFPVVAEICTRKAQ